MCDCLALDTLATGANCYQKGWTKHGKLEVSLTFLFFVKTPPRLLNHQKHVNDVAGVIWLSW